MSELRRTETCAETASHERSLLRIAGVAWWLLAIPGCVTCASGNHGSTTLPGSAGEASSTESNGGREGALAGAGSAGTSSTMPGPRGFPCKTGTVDPGPSPMKLLTRTEYLNSVHDLLGEIAGLDGALGAGRSASAFGLVQPDVAQVDLENYRNAANQASLAVAGNKSLLKQLAPCADGDPPRDCARTFVQTFAARAYRAPVADAADIELHLQLFDVGAKVSYAHGIELLMQGILQAPRFLYRVEVGGNEQVSDTAVKLSPYELASRLSYALWDTMPNEQLTAAARSGALATKDGILSQLGWMLQAPQGASVMRRFLENFIHLSDLDNSVKDATLYPEWQTSTLRASMKTQASTFFDDLLTKQGGKLSTLLTSRTVFVNQDLAPYYGTTGGASFTATDGSSDATSGLLTLPAFLSLLAKPSESSPIYRGKFVREMLLCQQLPGPPANIPKPPDVSPGVSTRERLSEHESNASCSGCHRLMDPIGLSFENYDSLGRYRTMDGREPVDASGELFATAEIDGKFTGVPELGQKLAQSETVRQCMARQWFRFALQRFEQPVDDCSMQGLLDSFEAADADLNTLPQAIVLSDAFQYRHPVDSEGLQMNAQQPLDQRTRLSRRNLLSGLSALTVAVTSPIWRSATVFGADEKTPAARRFIGVFSANGTIAKDFFPAGSGSGVPLTLGRILAPLADHKAQLMVLKGVHMNSTVQNELGKDAPVSDKPGGPHMKGPGAMLTGGSLQAGSFTGSGGPAGYADRISVDQYIASRIGTKTKFPSLEFGARIEGQEPLRVISYRGANQPNIAVDDPWQMYKRIFANADLSSSELEQVLAERKSVLDFLSADINTLKVRVASEDKARLEAHLTSIRSLEQELTNTPISCKPLTMPAKLDVRAMENFAVVSKLQMDLMLLAHICGLTNVSTLMFANADSWQYYPWIDVNEEHHELSHAGDNDDVANEKLVKINSWHAAQFAYMMDKLRATKEADGSSMLDNTLMLWGNELGAGNSHTYKDIPWLLAGGAGGALKMGRYMQYSDQPHNNLLVSVCNAMGFDDVGTFGIPGVCTGPLPGLTA